MWAKQSIIIKKSPESETLSKAEKIARKYADRIYTHRETSTSFRFRQRDDDDFKPNTFRTEIKTKIVSIIWGELKEVDKSINSLKKEIMSVPKVKAGESEQDYVSRCIAATQHIADDAQRAAICYSTYRDTSATKESVSVLDRIVKSIKKIIK